MPAQSKSQFRFMKAVESGSIAKPGLSPAKAAEFTQGQSYSGLPERASTKLGQRAQRNAGQR